MADYTMRILFHTSCPKSQAPPSSTVRNAYIFFSEFSQVFLSKGSGSSYLIKILVCKRNCVYRVRRAHSYRGCPVRAIYISGHPDVDCTSIWYLGALELIQFRMARINTAKPLPQGKLRLLVYCKKFL